MAAERIRWTMVWLLGPLVWAAHFFLLYGVASFVCARSDFREQSIWLISLALTAIALATLAGFLVSQFIIDRESDTLLRQTSRLFSG